MALTMTRTRTQTALTKLAQLLAECNDELNLCHAVLEQRLVPLTGEGKSLVQARMAALESERQALHVTLRQFDQAIDPSCIGTSRAWLKTRCRNAKCLHAVYVATLNT